MKFVDLTWEDLEEWAGERIVSRGRSYKRDVKDLRVAADGALVAWVHGGDRYATTVRMDAAGDLDSSCTCPYPGTPCKHAVGLILAYLDLLKHAQQPPKANPGDARLKMLAGAKEGGGDDETERPVPDEDAKGNKLVRAHLGKLSKKELVKLLLAEQDAIPEMRRRLLDRTEMRKGSIARLVASIRREIDDASSEPGWSDHWRRESETPDYSGVKQRLKNLLDAGHADAVVELGEYLMERGVRQVGQSNDEGETGMEIADCMAIAFKAVTRSGLSASQRLLWEIDLRLTDEYDFLNGLKGPVEARNSGDKAAWSGAADVLSSRLAGLSVHGAGGQEGSSSRYHRAHVMRWLVHALEKAGRAREVIPLLESETAHTDCYEELVDKLIKAGRLEQAREWARKGFVQTLNRLPGIAWKVEERLRELAVRARDHPLAAAYRALEFLDTPEVKGYSDLRKAAIAAGQWDVIREPILQYLETGIRPDIPPTAGERSSGRQGDGATAQGEARPSPDGWPLPSTGLPAREKDPRWVRFPDTDTLIDIAILEKRHDDAIRWYRHRGKPSVFGVDGRGEDVARAVQMTHPDDAIAIWKGLVDREIAQVKPSAYQTAGGYLKKIGVVYARTGRVAEWAAYCAELRAQNVRRPRMIGVLNAIEGRRTPIIGG